MIKIWTDDKTVLNCSKCSSGFGILTRKHHCRLCGLIFCNSCVSDYIKDTNKIKLCERCYTEYMDTHIEVKKDYLEDLKIQIKKLSNNNIILEKDKSQLQERLINLNEKIKTVKKTDIAIETDLTMENSVIYTRVEEDHRKKKENDKIEQDHQIKEEQERRIKEENDKIEHEHQIKEENDRIREESIMNNEDNRIEQIETKNINKLSKSMDIMECINNIKLSDEAKEIYKYKKNKSERETEKRASTKEQVLKKKHDRLIKQQEEYLNSLKQIAQDYNSSVEKKGF